MSYDFSLNFIRCKSRGKAFNLAYDVAETVWKHAKEIIENEKFYIPATREGRKEPSNTDRFWLEIVFKMNFVWWPEQKVLALVGDNWPKEVEDMFTRQIVFQNSTDQDYDFETWTGICKYFDKIVDAAKEGNHKTIASMLRKSRDNMNYGEDPIGNEPITEYWRKSAVYNAIFQDMDMSKWLYGEESDKFVRFSVNALTSQERQFAAWTMLKGIITKG